MANLDAEEKQHTPGRTKPCCTSLLWATKAWYIKPGYFWTKPDPPVWVPWTLRISGIGWLETSPIHFCPFCGTDLDAREG